MALWLRFEYAGQTGFGTLEDGAVRVCSGEMFRAPAPTGGILPLTGLKVLSPIRPSKLIALVNNYREATIKQGIPTPAEPLYFLKAPSSFLAPGEAIRLPPPEAGKVIYEGELGIGIGREARGVAEADAETLGIGVLWAGSTVEVVIDGIGTLSNPVLGQERAP
jgi:2-keto-4-pentenoate hydratase/2-oxohepta-3-ene-1,7-dioic acid hydratase in catechol pathway